MARGASKAAPKKPTTPKFVPDQCHYRAGSYGSPKTANCKAKRLPNRQLCQAHEAAWKVEAKRRAAAKAGTTPKVATPTTIESEIPAVKEMKAKRVPKNSGGTKRESTPPAAARVPVARVNAPEQAPHVVQMVAPE